MGNFFLRLFLFMKEWIFTAEDFSGRFGSFGRFLRGEEHSNPLFHGHSRCKEGEK